MRKDNVEPADFGKLCVAQRANASSNPYALLRKPLTLEDYLGSRMIADPIRLFDCVMPCAGADGFLVTRRSIAEKLGLPKVSLLATIERHNAFPDDPIQIRGGWAQDVNELYEQAGCGPGDMDFLQAYDDYPVIVMMQMEDLGFCRKGEAAEFVRRNTFTIDGSLSAQYVRWSVVNGAGRRGGWASGRGRGHPPVDRAAADTANSRYATRPRQRLRDDQLRPRTLHRRRNSWK